MRKFSAKYNLKGKTSIVIGGLGLIGWSITESLIYSGSKVFIIDKDEIFLQSLKIQSENE